MNNVKKLSDFIDSLNDEKKHTVKADSEELNRMFDAVRQIKSLKSPAMPDEDFPHRIIQNLTEKNRHTAKSGKRTWAGGFAGIAAVLAVALLANFAGPIKNSYVVYAVEQAYNDVKAYHGTLEVVFSNEAGETQTQSVLDVWADKSGNYYIEVLEGSYKGLKTVSDGKNVWQSPTDENAMNVLPVFSETNEFIFELGNEVDELQNAESARIIGDDDIAGRPAYVMEVTPKGGLPYKLWVDKGTKIPLQKQSSMYKAIQYTTRYTVINFAESIPEELLTVGPDTGFKEVDPDGYKNTVKNPDKPEDITADIAENNKADSDTAKYTPEITVDVDMDIEKAEQIAADSGSSPWKLDPVYVAQVFISLQISPEGIVGEYPIHYNEFVIAESNGTSAKIEVISEKTHIKAVYLEKLIRQDDTGIWTVTGYDISP